MAQTLMSASALRLLLPGIRRSYCQPRRVGGSTGTFEPAVLETGAVFLGITILPRLPILTDKALLAIWAARPGRQMTFKEWALPDYMRKYGPDNNSLTQENINAPGVCVESFLQRFFLLCRLDGHPLHQPLAIKFGPDLYIPFTYIVKV